MNHPTVCLEAEQTLLPAIEIRMAPFDFVRVNCTDKTTTVNHPKCNNYMIVNTVRQNPASMNITP